MFLLIRSGVVITATAFVANSLDHLDCSFSASKKLVPKWNLIRVSYVHLLDLRTHLLLRACLVIASRYDFGTSTFFERKNMMTKLVGILALCFSLNAKAKTLKFNFAS